LNPAKNQQTSSLIQPKLTIGNQPTPLVPPVQFSVPKLPTTQGLETTNIPPSMMIPPLIQNIPMAQDHSQFAPPMKDLNPPIPPPPQQTGTCK